MSKPNESAEPARGGADAPSPDRPRGERKERGDGGKVTAFHIHELRVLHSGARSIFVLMFILAAALIAYIAIRVFLLQDVRNYIEFGSLCLFAAACSALCVGQLFCMRRIRHGAREKIERMTFVDDLTGVYNYRFLEQRLFQELQRAVRHGSHLSVIYFDIDRFKGVNDNFGHEAGNEVLRRVADTCRVSARGEDFVGRLGGDEFLIVLPETDSSGALIAAERVKTRLNEADYAAPSGEPIDFLGFSMGVASCPASGETPADLIRAADEAMYRAKKSGGNRVCL
ncbi:GGDEF domain-containing protein [bacterium]|nr:GGDEF domain-containing protein [bacterium]